GAGLHRDLLYDVADFHLEVDGELVVHVQGNVVLDGFLEAFLLYSDRVGADREKWRGVIAVRIGFRSADYGVAVDVSDGDFGSGNGGPGRVDDRPHNGTSNFLCQ